MPPAREAAALLAVLLLAFALRVWNLPQESAWYDEVLTLACLDAPDFAAFTECCVAQGDNTGLISAPYRFVEYHWARVAGPSVPAQRALSAGFGMASIAVVHLLGRRVFGPRAGLIAALLLALALPHVFFSQEIRRYALEILLTLAGFLHLTALRRAGWASGRFNWAWLSTALVLNGLLWLTSPFTVLLLPAQTLFLLAMDRAPLWRRFLPWLFLQAILAGSIVLALAAGDHAHLNWLMPPTWRELVNTLVVFGGGRFSNDSPAAWLPGGVSLDVPLALCLLTTALAAVPLRRDRPLAVAALLAWLVIPVAFWFVYAHLREPVYLYRWLYFAALPVPLLAGGALAALPRPRRSLWLAALVLAMGWQATILLRGPFRPDYAAAAGLMTAAGEHRPVLVLKERLNGLPLLHLGTLSAGRMRYAHGQGDLHALGRELGQGPEGAWVLTWRWDRQEAFEAAMRAAGLEVQTHVLGGLPPLVVHAVSPAEPPQHLP